MSNFSRYLPFFIITLLGYGVIFYQKDTLLSQEPDVAPKKQIVQISSLTQENRIPAETIVKTEGVTVVKISEAKNEDEITEVPPPEHKAPNQTVPTKIKVIKPLDFTKTKAIDVAILKGTELDEMLYLHLNLPKRPIKKRKKRSRTAKAHKNNNQKVASKNTASKKITLKKVTSKKVESNSITAQVLNQPAKQKRIFKRVDNDITPQLSKQDNPHNLPEAIAITGNKPDYPEQARVLNQKGLVVIQFLVTTRGETRNPSIMVSSGYSELDRAVIAFVVKERFMPALKNNEKVTAEQIYSFSF